MKKFAKLIPLLIIILSIVIVPIASRADFGDFSGDSDYGGWDSGGWDSGGSDWDSSWDDDYSWDDDSDYSSSSGGGADPSVAIIFIVIVLIIIIASKVAEKKSAHTMQENYTSDKTKSSLRRMSKYTDVDPNFSAAEFVEKLSNLYVRFQNEWQAKDISSLRPYLTDAMFAQMDRQLDSYRRSNQTNCVERISVLSVQLSGWKQEGGLDVIIARLNTRIVDYVIDDATGNVVRGSKTTEKFMTYEWTLVRTTGMLTVYSAGTTSQTCPHCGAQVNINHSTVCDYCDSVLTTDTFNWAVSNIKGLSQRSQN